MAEGILRNLLGDIVEVGSAGSHPSGFVHPLAVQVMREIGIDLSSHRSKGTGEFSARPVDTLITVCGKADQACLLMSGAPRRHHWPFDDPALAEGSDDQILNVFRAVRDQIQHACRFYADGRRDGLGSTPQHE